MTGFFGLEVPTADDLHVPDPPPDPGLPDVVHYYDVTQLTAGPGDGLTSWSDFSDNPDPLIGNGVFVAGDGAIVAGDGAIGDYVAVPPGGQLSGGTKRVVGSGRTIVILMRTALINTYVGSFCGFRIRRSSGGAYQLVSPNPPSGGGAKTITGGGAAANTSNGVILAVSLSPDGGALLNVGGTDVVVGPGAFDLGTTNFTTPSFSVDSAQSSGVDIIAIFERAKISTSAEFAAMRTVQEARRPGVFT